MIPPQVVHRLATDSTFATHFLNDPQNALADAGLVIDEEAIAGLLAVLRDDPNWPQLCAPDMDIPEVGPWTS